MKNRQKSKDRLKKSPNLNQLLKNELFFKHYELLQHALNKNRLLSPKFFIDRIQSKIPTNKKRKVKIQIEKEQIDSFTPDKTNPAQELDNTLKDYHAKASKNKKTFLKFNRENKMFSVGYNLLHKNKSEKYLHTQLFKNNPLLMRNQSDINLFYYGQNSQINPVESKYIRTLSRFQDLIDYVGLVKNVDGGMKNEKFSSSGFYQKYPIPETNEKIRKKDNEINQWNKKIEDNSKIINLTKNTINCITVNPNYFEENEKKPPKTIYSGKKSENENNILNSNLTNPKKKSMNSTSSTGFYSPHSTYRSSFYHNSNKISYSPSPVTRRKKALRKSLTLSHSVIDLFSLDSFSSSSYGTRKMNYELVEGMYNKLRKCENIIETSKLIERCFSKDVINKLTGKGRGQVYNVIVNTKRTASSKKVKDEINKIYDSKVPYETNKKIKQLNEIEEIINSFDFRFFKSLINSKIK